jgi:hypothetical protein
MVITGWSPLRRRDARSGAPRLSTAVVMLLRAGPLFSFPLSSRRSESGSGAWALGARSSVPVIAYHRGSVQPARLSAGRLDSYRLVICARAVCRRVFFLRRHCDRGDRYCSAECTQRARRASLRGRGPPLPSPPPRAPASRRASSPLSRPAAESDDQTSPGPVGSGIVPAPLSPEASGHEEVPDAEVARPVVRLSCARCGRAGRFVRHTTLVHVRPRLLRRR